MEWGCLSLGAKNPSPLSAEQVTRMKNVFTKVNFKIIIKGTLCGVTFSSMKSPRPAVRECRNESSKVFMPELMIGLSDGDG